MSQLRNKEVGALIGRLIAKGDLSYDEAYAGFLAVLNDETSELQQGAFLAALSAKGETVDEVAAAWRAIYDLDTEKAEGLGGLDLVENSGTGMDGFKTFNISTAASLVAAAGGVKVARHGARALSSACGTVDMAEALGVDVEGPVSLAARSIRAAGIGLFNGMSPAVHPRALGRILSQISFGSTLNISASLANPAFPKIAVRGVYSPAMVRPVAEAMRRIGIRRGMVYHGRVDGLDRGMDEFSVCGETSGLRWGEDGGLEAFSVRPEDLSLPLHPSGDLAPETEAPERRRAFLRLLAGRGPRSRLDCIALNAAAVFAAAGTAADLAGGVALARGILESGAALETLRAWVAVQNRDRPRGEAVLEAALADALGAVPGGR